MGCLVWAWLLALVLVAGKPGGKKLSSTTSEISTSYGTDLPSFAYDFSEYVTSAVIERAGETNELFLTMFLVGHDVVFNDYPFETISTDEDTVYNWGQASKIWDRNKNRTALTRHSGLVCMLKNNDPKHSQPYRVPALWVPTTESPDTRLHGSLEILRCRLKGTTTIYHTLSKMPDAALFADIIRLVPLRSDPNPNPNRLVPLRNEPGKAKRGAAASKAGAAQQASRRLQASSLSAAYPANKSRPSSASFPEHRAYDVMLSFSVPWRSRIAGYGLGSAPSLNASRHDPWQGSHRHAFLYRNRSSQALAASGNATYMGAAGLPKVHICVAGLRPLHPMRPSVGLPMLLEFVEHHVALGVDHIFLGLLLSPRSPHFSRHAHVLRGYIEREQVSLASLALESFDDAGGFGGVHMQDEYTAMLFHNQCLYFSKGVADFVVLLRPTEFLAPAAALQQQMLVSTSSASSPSFAVLLRALPLSPARTHALGTACYYKVAGSYGLPDPPENFGLFAGPADSAFSADFFKTSRAVGALNSSKWHAPVLPTRLVMATTSRDAAICVVRQAEHDGKRAVRGAGLRIVRAQPIDIPPAALLSFILGANLKNADYKSARQSRQDAILDFSAAARHVSRAAQKRLAGRGFPDVGSLVAVAAKGAQLHAQRANEATAAAAFQEKEQRRRTPLLEVPTAKAMKAPFWLRCDVAALHEILSKVFT